MPSPAPASDDDSGETIVIPFYDKNTANQSELTAVNSDDDDGDDDSEYVKIHFETNVSESPVDEIQSQFVMANIDQSLIRAALEENHGKNTDRSAAAREPLKTDANKENIQNDEPSNKEFVDRSGSTTPDLDFLTDSNEKVAEVARPEANVDDTETQMIETESQDIFDACTQQVQQTESPKQTLDDDIYSMATQKMPTFKVPSMISSTPRAAPKSKPSIAVAAAASEQSVYDVATQMMPGADDDEDIFNEATQILPSEKPSPAITSKQTNNATDHNKSGNQFTRLFSFDLILFFFYILCFNWKLKCLPIGDASKLNMN